MKHTFACLSLAAFSLASTPFAADLEIGDVAPEIQVAKWLKGDAFTLESAKGNQVTILEFWASW